MVGMKLGVAGNVCRAFLIEEHCPTIAICVAIVLYSLTNLSLTYSDTRKLMVKLYWLMNWSSSKTFFICGGKMVLAGDYL